MKYQEILIKPPVTISKVRARFPRSAVGGTISPQSQRPRDVRPGGLLLRHGQVRHHRQHGEEGLGGGGPRG